MDPHGRPLKTAKPDKLRECSRRRLRPPTR
jgi:hypothetical protein